ncbi:Uncharacterized protein dnm_098820 [Desulfonema magnum]|uniref:Uncharacterized protein n=1 Tax=Desulfonema magnum TaxID=45655 RepID=A0A975C0I9_9BACT|nr:Uncharacterized protein dnm_098820 [Desulfonema magnum]
MIDAVSIHAPRAGSDIDKPVAIPSQKSFNPRPPCGERLFVEPGKWHIRFVSIHAPRAGSDDRYALLKQGITVSIHAPRAGSDMQTAKMLAKMQVSIHAPRAGSDQINSAEWSRTPVSIHAPRAGSDLGLFLLAGCSSGFNPRPPCGERHDKDLLTLG